MKHPAANCGEFDAERLGKTTQKRKGEKNV
jgi:hypothetical protein